jgi:hypothetical protein
MSPWSRWLGLAFPICAVQTTAITLRTRDKII